MKNPRKLAKAAIRSIYAFLGAEFLLTLATIYHIRAIGTVPKDAPMSFIESPDELLFADMVVGLAALLYLAALLMAGFLVLKWVHRSNAIAQALASGMSITPGWSIGWFFIPIGNLWKPFEGVRQSWQVSHDPAAWQEVPVPTHLRWWWACWLVWGAVSNASFRLALRAETVSDYLLTDYLDVASGIVALPLGLLLVWIIRRLTDAQLARIDSGF